MREVRLVLMLAALALVAVADTVDVSRHGRRVQVDGFLLEWSGGSARAWTDAWVWDAVITPEGVAGYVASRGAPECGEWVFGIGAGDGAAMEVRVPDGGGAVGNAVFDRDGFDREGAYNIEWLVPWNAMGGGGASRYIALTAENACGGALPDVAVRVVVDARPGGVVPVPVPAALVTMAAAAALTVAIAAIRRKRRRVSGHSAASAKK